MKNKYFDTEEFRFAISFINSNPKFAKLKLEEYLQFYSKDYSTYPYYASVLITLGKFKEAEKILYECERRVAKDKSFPLNKLKILKQNILLTTIRLLTYQERFQELKNLLQNNQTELEKTNLNSVDFYIKRKTNSIDGIEREHNSYLFRQIIEYSEDEFLEHIKKHMEEHKDEFPDAIGIFGMDFPMSDVLNEIKIKLQKGKCLFPGFYEDFYTFKYPKCGTVEGIKTDYFQIICFHNTSNIITLFPSIDGEHLPYMDLSYLVKKDDEEKPKVKIKKSIK